MKNIKFRYRHKSKETGYIAVDIVTIEELYQGNYMAGLRDTKYWEFLSVDLFTGLTDKNGKEIYENDLVKNNTGRIMQVIYFCSVCYSGFDLKYIGGDGKPPTNRLWEDLEIISNIHEEQP